MNEGYPYGLDNKVPRSTGRKRKRGKGEKYVLELQDNKKGIYKALEDFTVKDKRKRKAVA